VPLKEVLGHLPEHVNHALVEVIVKEEHPLHNLHQIGLRQPLFDHLHNEPQTSSDDAFQVVFIVFGILQSVLSHIIVWVSTIFNPKGIKTEGLPRNEVLKSSIVLCEGQRL